MSKAERPWVKWYWSDWRADPALRVCSLAARGLWAELLGIMQEAEPYGHLLIGGVAPTSKQIASLVGATAAQVEALLAELKRAGVPSETPEGVIYSRRMVRDRERQERDKANGKRGGNPSLNGGVNPPDKPPDNGAVKAHMPEARGQKPEKEKQDNAPSAPADIVWSGRIVRLTRRDFDKWRASYPNVDMEAELQAADDYYADKDPKNGWFFAVSNWLKRANNQAKGGAGGEGAADDGCSRF